VPPLTDRALLQSDIMIVDDNPANLKLLEDMLVRQGHEVRSFPRGRLALTAATMNPPDLILLDINMPEMNGYEVCQQLKSSERLSGIPVIFLSALTATEDKVKGFCSGGIDYISKPFQLEEVQARVETHVKLRRAQQTEHDLLERTLGGAVEAFWELVQLTSPVLALRGRAIREIVLCVTKRVEIKDAWQFELAAALCLVGCIVLPDDVLEKAYCGQDLSPDEDRMFRAHPERAAHLFSNIPRLEPVAEIIRGQQHPGATVLHLALELDRKIYCGVACSAALQELRLSGRFETPMLDALKSYSPPHDDFDLRRLSVRDLRAGMILEVDIFDKDRNVLILKEGTILKDMWIERLENFVKGRGAKELIGVRIPRPGVRKPHE
jgi:response regulator RpfG family c-di-GMP phosphodiesterase